MRIKILDIIIIIITAAAAFYAVYFAYIMPRGQTQVFIQAQERQWFFPISAQETVVVKGLIGDTVIKIDGNRAWVESSPCENQNCVATGNAVRQGQWAACLPNNVLLIIEGTKSEDADTIAW